MSASKNEGYIHEGELVVITTGVPTGVSGTTNLIKVQVISEEICQGIGIGRTTVEGLVRFVKSGQTCENFNEGDILVTTMTDKDMNPYIEKAAAIVLSFGVAAIIGVLGLNLETILAVYPEDVDVTIPEAVKLFAVVQVA